MKLFKETLPGNVHPSGLVVVAFLFLIGYWYFTHKLPDNSMYTTQDIGAGGGIIPHMWDGDAFQWDESGETGESDLREAHFASVLASRAPVAHEPQVLQGGKRTSWYRFIDQQSYNQRRQPFLEKRMWP